MPEPHQPPYYNTNEEALEALTASIRDINCMIAGSLRAIQETRQLLTWIDTWPRRCAALSTRA
jgi:hypothetical protein